MYLPQRSLHSVRHHHSCLSSSTYTVSTITQSTNIYAHDNRLKNSPGDRGFVCPALLAEVSGQKAEPRDQQVARLRPHRRAAASRVPRAGGETAGTHPYCVSAIPKASVNTISAADEENPADRMINGAARPAVLMICGLLSSCNCLHLSILLSLHA